MVREDNWAFEIESEIFTTVKTKAMPILQEQFPDTDFSESFTNVKRSLDKAVFPTIYIHELPGVQKGQTLDAVGIDAVLESFQVDVITNTSQGDTKKILGIVLNVFVMLRFSVTAMPEFNNESEKKFRCTGRVRRLIGASDSL